jgi:hypothetical protein
MGRRKETSDITILVDGVTGAVDLHDWLEGEGVYDNEGHEHGDFTATWTGLGTVRVKFTDETAGDYFWNQMDHE